MDDVNPVQSPGDKMKRAIRWLSETVQQCPAKPRRQIIEEAQIRFDLSPAECAFLEKNFNGQPTSR